MFFHYISLNPQGFWAPAPTSLVLRQREESCMYASIFNKPCFLTMLHTSPDSIHQRPWCEFFPKPCLCLLFMCCLNAQRPLPVMERSPPYFGLQRSASGAAVLGKRKRESNERTSSLQWPDINQINYGATTSIEPMERK